MLLDLSPSIEGSKKNPACSSRISTIDLFTDMAAILNKLIVDNIMGC